MNKNDILVYLEKFNKENNEKYNIKEIGLFGSFAKGQEKKNSDIDIVVKLNKQDLFNIIGIKQDLEDILHFSVDVISYREKMNSFLKNRINKEAVYV